MTEPRLTPALPGARVVLAHPDGEISFYASGPGSGPERAPLLLVHSINAAPSAYEMRPLYEHFARSRRVWAVDLPGFGFSERLERDHSPRTMTDSIHAVVSALRAETSAPAVDVVALSLSCEFVARAASEDPASFRKLCLISPTGFSRRTAGGGSPLAHRALESAFGRSLFRLLTRRGVIRYFLERTFGSKNIDAGLAEYAWLTSHQPGAEHAPFRFLCGLLFSADIGSVYRSLGLPVLVIHGVRGDFVDYSRKAGFADRGNWRFQTWPTGAMPHFEQPVEVNAAVEEFLADG